MIPGSLTTPRVSPIMLMLMLMLILVQHSDTACHAPKSHSRIGAHMGARGNLPPLSPAPAGSRPALAAEAAGRKATSCAACARPDGSAAGPEVQHPKRATEAPATPPWHSLALAPGACAVLGLLAGFSGAILHRPAISLLLYGLAYFAGGWEAALEAFRALRRGIQF